MLCNVCLEEFPSFITNSTTTEMCHRCNLDTQTPKIFSAENNMNPGPVPPELLVCYINLYYLNARLLLNDKSMNPLYTFNTELLTSVD